MDKKHYKTEEYCISKMKKSGQASVEFMIIMGFMISILIPLSILYYEQLNTMTTSVKSVQLNKVANEVVDKAEEAYYLGSPTKITMKAYIPSGVESVIIRNHEVDFKLKTNTGINDIFALSKVNLTGSIKNYSGIHTIVIEAKEDHVKITG